MRPKRRIRAMILAALMPGAMALSCNSSAIREVRDAMLDSLGLFVQEATTDFLNGLINTDETL